MNEQVRRHHVPRAELSPDTGQTSGMRRSEAISGERTGAAKIWMGESHVLPGARSGDHHHGASETGIHVLSGHPVFVFSEDGRERRVETSPGDYVFVPPFVPHREENSSPEETAVVAPSGLKAERELAAWVRRGVAFTTTLPSKQPVRKP